MGGYALAPYLIASVATVTKEVSIVGTLTLDFLKMLLKIDPQNAIPGMSPPLWADMLMVHIDGDSFRQ